MPLRSLAVSPRRNRLLKENKTPKTVPEERPLEDPLAAQELSKPSSNPFTPAQQGQPHQPAEESSLASCDFVNHFWESDGPKILFDRLNASSELLQTYRAFLKERAATEKDYAKQLRRTAEASSLLKSVHKEAGGFQDALDRQLSALHSVADAHEALGTTVSTTLEPRLKEHHQACEERRKKQQSAAETSWKAKVAAQTVLSSATEKYKKESNSITSYSAQLTIVAPREVARVQANLDKCRKNIGKVAEEYKGAIKSFKHASSNFEYDFKMFCDLAQDLEEDKVSVLCEIGAHLAELETRTTMNISKIHEGIPFEEVDISTCISDFVRSKATGSRIYNAPEFVDFERNPNVDTNLSFRKAAFPRSSFRYPTARMTKRSSTASLSGAATPASTDSSPRASPTRQRNPTRLVPPRGRYDSTSGSSAKSSGSSRVQKSSDPPSEESNDPAEELEQLRIGSATPEPEYSRQHGEGDKKNVMAIGGRVYAVDSPTPSPQTPDRVLQPMPANTSSRGHLPTPPYGSSQASTAKGSLSNGSPMRRKTASGSRPADVPADMPSEELQGDAFAEIEAWLANNKIDDPGPADPPAPATTSSPHKESSRPAATSSPGPASSGLPVPKSRHAQRKVPLPSSPTKSLPSQASGLRHQSSMSEANAVPRRSDSQKDVFLSSPASPELRPKSPRGGSAIRRSASPMQQHGRSHSEADLVSHHIAGIPYRRSPSPAPPEATARPVSTSFVAMPSSPSKTFNRPRQPTPEETYLPPQHGHAVSPAPTSTTPVASHFSPYPVVSSPPPFSQSMAAPTMQPQPTATPWPPVFNRQQSHSPQLMRHASVMQQHQPHTRTFSESHAASPHAFSPYQPATSPAPFAPATAMPTSSASVPTGLSHMLPQSQPATQMHHAPPHSPVVCMVRAEHPYTASQEDELSILPGEEIAILKTDSSGWWYGQSRISQRMGLIPSNHVRML